MYVSASTPVRDAEDILRTRVSRLFDHRKVFFSHLLVGVGGWKLEPICLVPEYVTSDETDSRFFFSSSGCRD